MDTKTDSPSTTPNSTAGLPSSCALPSLQARLVLLACSWLDQSILTRHRIGVNEAEDGGRAAGRGRAVAPPAPTLALWRGGCPEKFSCARQSTAGARGTPPAALPAQGHQPQEQVGELTLELPGPTMAPGRRQAGAGTTPEPRGEGEHMDIVPPPSSSLSTRTTTGQPAAPPLPPTNATLQAGATPGSGVLPPTTAAAGPSSAPPGQEGCSCPHVPQHKPGAQQGAAAEGQAPRAFVPTPRTEEAAWAASALTVLLVLLTLAVLYTRLHRKFRKSQSLYWAPGDAGQEPISAVIKRRLLRPHGRHKKRHRQQRLLLQEASSESSDS